MGYLTVSHVKLGAEIGDLDAKDSHSFCKQARELAILEFLPQVNTWTYTLEASVSLDNTSTNNRK